MTIEAATLPDTEDSCLGCEACCCRLEVLLITDTGVPDRYIEVDKWGGRRMARLDDGWCSALDRNTMLCSIYEKRPAICRELEMGEYECLTERAARALGMLVKIEYRTDKRPFYHSSTDHPRVTKGTAPCHHPEI